MIAGRVQWREPHSPLPRRRGLAAFDFADGSLIVTEAGSRKRASLHVVSSDDLELHDPGGMEVLEADFGAFAAVLRLRNYTL